MVVERIQQPSIENCSHDYEVAFPMDGWLLIFFLNERKKEGPGPTYVKSVLMVSTLPDGRATVILYIISVALPVPLSLVCKICTRCLFFPPPTFFHFHVFFSAPDRATEILYTILVLPCAVITMPVSEHETAMSRSRIPTYMRCSMLHLTAILLRAFSRSARAQNELFHYGFSILPFRCLFFQHRSR